jgi:hypothetical protein
VLYDGGALGVEGALSRMSTFLAAAIAKSLFVSGVWPESKIQSRT